jgi:hypothetical protein
VQIRRGQQARLAELVAYARQHSAYYRDLYRELPEHIEDVTLLPVTNSGAGLPVFLHAGGGVA